MKGCEKRALAGEISEDELMAAVVPALMFAAEHGYTEAQPLLRSIVGRVEGEAGLRAKTAFGEFLWRHSWADDDGIDYLFLAAGDGGVEAVHTLARIAAEHPRKGKKAAQVKRIREWSSWRWVVLHHLIQPTNRTADVFAAIFSIGSKSIVAGTGQIVGQLHSNPLFEVPQQRLLADLLRDPRLPWNDEESAAKIYEELANEGDEASIKRLMTMDGQLERLRRLRRNPHWAVWPATPKRKKG